MIPITLYASKVLYHLLSPQHKSQQDKYQKDQLCSKQQETFKRFKCDTSNDPASIWNVPSCKKYTKFVTLCTCSKKQKY